MNRIAAVLACLSLAGCYDPPTQYGWAFLLICPNEHMGYTSDKDGRVIRIDPSLITTVFIPYDGGMFVDGRHVPMEFNRECTLIKAAATESKGMNIKGFVD